MTRRAVLGGALVAVGTVLAQPRAAFAQAANPAPDFAAIDSDGKAVKLSDFRGKTVVLEWTNHECPFVQKHYNAGNMQALQAEATGKGVVWLTVISSAKGSQGYVEGLEASQLTDERKAKPSAVLLDPTGKLGRQYNATASLHMFVIGPSGVVAYNGAIDDKPSFNPDDIPKARNYVREAIAAVALGKPMSPSATRPYGCPIKYAGT